MARLQGGFLSPVSSVVYADARTKRGGSAADRFIRGERVVLSRALTHFELVTRPPGSINPRTIQAARMAAQARTPFRDADIYLVWGARHVGVWSWPKSSLESLGKGEFHAVPETVLHAPADGLALRACMEGFEGQLWQDGELTASRWWPYQPGADEWAAFVRGLKGDHVVAVPTPERPALNAPAQPLSYRVLDMVRRPSLKDIAALAVVLLAVPLLYLGGQAISLQTFIMQANGELASLQNVTGDVVEARTQARYSATQLTVYDEILTRTHPMEILAVFAEAAEEAGTQLESANITGRRLEMVLQASEDLTPASLVELLENHPSLSGVRFAPLGQANLWRVEADVEGPEQ